MLTTSPNTREPGPPCESSHALDWVNFFLAALLVGFGPFVAVHFAEQGWTPASIGVVLTISGLAGLLTQVPAGELVDMVRSKRALVGVGAAAAILALSIFGLRVDFPSAAAAAVLQGTAGSIFGPRGHGDPTALGARPDTRW
jgi:MFS family permease